MTRVFEKASTVEQWDKDYYQPIAQKLYDRAIEDMLRIMSVPPGATVLDAGCGPGVHSIRAAKAGCRVCAVDISETMLEHARHRVAEANVADRVVLLQKDLTRLDFGDDSFRYVFSWGVLIHIPEAEKALDELARVVAPGGSLALYITNRRALDYKIERVCRFLARKPLQGMQRLPLGDGIWYGSGSERLWVWRFDSAAICGHLRRKGFRLLRRRIGELSEIQRRVSGPLRNLLLRINNTAYRCNLPARPALGQLLVFQKPPSDSRADADRTSPAAPVANSTDRREPR